MSAPSLRCSTPLVLLAALAAPAAHAGTILSYPNFSNVSALTFVGNSTGPVTNGPKQALELASTATSSSGAVYPTQPVTLGANGAFETEFQFQMTGGNPFNYWGDGMTFFLSASPTGLGQHANLGGGLGYQGVPNSLAVEFDIYQNPGQDLEDNEVAVDIDGNVNTAAFPAGYVGAPYGVTSACFVAGREPAGCMADGKIWTAKIIYNGTVMNVYVQDGTAALYHVITNLPVNLEQTLGNPATVYTGFTAGNGGYTTNIFVNDWAMRQ